MSNIGKLTTFSRLLNEESVIMIPKVQRDYAYGRKETKVMAILDGMLDIMFEAVSDHKPVILDFVYGGSFVKKNDEASGMIPLDGQQRLTTLFLLHFYASLVQDCISSDKVKCLKKFRYETRQSATDFCDSLIDGIRDSLLSEVDGVKTYNEDTAIKDLIKDSPMYLPSYDSDPTISSMLNVLEVIEEKYRNRPIENFWTKLLENDDIRFYSLSLEKFGLTDDLYIKMNSRGKKLTAFEIFKSDLEKAINKISQTLKDELSKKIDNSWMDVVWEYACTNPSSSKKENDMSERADAGFMTLFNNVFRMEMFRRGLETKNNRTPGIEEIITDEQSIKEIISIFDTISDIHVSTGIRKFWDKYFYFSDDLEGESEKVRLFWLRKELQKPVFYLGMEKEWSVPETVYFYTIYQLHKSQKTDDVIAKCLRICRNLVTANVRANSARYDMLPGFMKDMECVIAFNGQISVNPDKTFVATAWDEEVYKCNNLGKEEYQELLKYENHNILQGSVMLFIDKYGVKDNALTNALSHFAGIFSNDAKLQATNDRPSDFNRIRINFLNKDTEYMQARRWMINEQNGICRRLFLHKWDDLTLFFIKNTDLAFQDNILTVLDGMELKSVEDKTKEFNKYDWQYYMAKYEGSNRQDTKGVYLWEDKVNRPLEIILLNSQYHSEYNLEWVMLNHILISEIWDDNQKYSLDPHACSPVILNKLGHTLTFTQEGWKLTCKDEEAVKTLKSTAKATLNVEDLGENVYIVDFDHKDHELDYIDLAKIIISTIEEADKRRICTLC